MSEEGGGAALKVTVGGLTGLKIPEGTPIYVVVVCGDSEGSTIMQPYIDNMQFTVSFQYAFENEHEIEVIVFDAEETVLGRAFVPLANVIKMGAAAEVAELSPSGQVDLTLRFQEGPGQAPKYLTVQVYSAHNLGGSDFIGKIDPYCIIKLDNEVIGRTKTIKGGGSDVEWQNEVLTVDYKGQQLFSLELWDADRLSKDDLVGETTLDLWDQLRKTTKPNIRGHLALSKANKSGTASAGLVDVSLNFWDEQAEREREQHSLNGLGIKQPDDAYDGPRGLTSTSSSSSSSSRRSSSSHGPTPSEEARARAAEEAAARRLEEEAKQEALAMDADELARKAKEAFDKARQHHNDTFELAQAHPEVKGMLEPLKKAEKGADSAEEGATNARQCANECHEAPNLDVAMGAYGAAKRSADQAQRGERQAYLAYKEAKKLIRKEEKKREEKQEKLRDLEAQKALEEAEARERARQAEHMRDLEIRRVIVAPTDVNEARLYQGVTGYSYHNREKEIVSPVQVASPLACCGPARNANITRQASDESLRPTIPKHELRGIRQQAGSVEDDETGDGHHHHHAGHHQRVLLEDDGIMETLGGLDRPWCWCFGCGCCRCCGEC